MRKSIALLVATFLVPEALGQQADSWYSFTPKSDPAPGAIGMQDWLEKPAGEHGRILRKDDQLLYNGKPIKLWGANLCFATCAPEKELADKRAAFYPKYGINTIRLHKFADGAGWNGIQAADSAAEYDPAGLERMDYQVARLTAAGIYTTLSAHFGAVQMGPADKRDVPYLEEFGSFGGGKGAKNRVAAPHSAFFYSPELQNVQIRQIVNLLKHKNPHTGMTYAEDPAICAIEIINEQSILFYTTMGPLQRSPTLRTNVGERFCRWLRTKYGGRDGLLKAWGDKALDGFQRDGFPAGEDLDKGTILPLGNPWYWDPAQLAGSQAFRRQRLLDSLKFLYELQCEAYDRYVKAVREAGYKGEILGSNWQAGRGFSHYANLHSDWRVGLIDRHNYFGGGGGGGRGKTGRFDNSTMLAVPGSALLSTGMQQAIDRPFMLSEWIHVYPNEWGVEGPAILGAYGMGLQGWDVSYMFQNGDAGAFSSKLGGTWDVMAPQILGIFPAVARQILRGDVKQSQVVARRCVHVPSLFEGKIGFEDRVSQQYDVKTFDGDKVPAGALAVARTAVEFTETYRDTPAFDLAAYRKDGWLVASTGQLRWREGKSKLDGLFAMDTPGTKAVVGFGDGQAVELGGLNIQPQCRFAAIYITARERDKDLVSSKELIVVAMARARNTGQTMNDAEDHVLQRGASPVVLEPVKATLTLKRAGSPKVILLDHDGLETDKTLPVEAGRIAIDGSRDKTPYYLIRY